MKKIDKKIVGYSVNQPSQNTDSKKNTQKEEPREHRAEVIRMHEKLERPEILVGSTYKVKTPHRTLTQTSGGVVRTTYNAKLKTQTSKANT